MGVTREVIKLNARGMTPRKIRVAVDAIGLGAFRRELDQFWSKALTAYKAAVEEPLKEVP